MKKNNLIKLATIFLIALLSSSFTFKDEHLLADTVNTSEYTNEILVSYPSGSNISEIRNCISNSFGGQILQITQCPSNPNIEILKFLNLRFPKANTNGLHDGNDPDQGINPDIQIEIIQNSSFYVSQTQILNVMANCNAFIFAYYGNQDCGDFGAFQSSF